VAKTKVICVKFFLDVARQKLLKLANVSWSYSKNKSGTFLWTTVYCRIAGFGVCIAGFFIVEAAILLSQLQKTLTHFQN